MSKQMTDEEVFARAAQLLAGRHGNEALSPILQAQMLYIANATPSSGGAGYVRWISGLEALGEMILSIAKQERNMARHYKIKG